MLKIRVSLVRFRPWPPLNPKKNIEFLPGPGRMACACPMAAGDHRTFGMVVGLGASVRSHCLALRRPECEESCEETLSGLQIALQVTLSKLLAISTILLNNTRHASPRKRTRAGFLLPAGDCGFRGMSGHYST